MTLERVLETLVLGFSLTACDGAAKTTPEASAKGSANRPATPTASPAVQPEPEPEPDAIPVTGDANRARPRSGLGPTSIPAGVPTPGPGESLSDCLGRCTSAGLSEDNLATCKLLCEAHHAQGSPTPTGPAVVDAYFSCFDPCAGDLGCARRCPASVAKTDACAKACLSTLGRCLEPCAGPNEGRCAEACETTARSCIGRCAS